MNAAEALEKYLDEREIIPSRFLSATKPRISRETKESKMKTKTGLTPRLSSA